MAEIKTLKQGETQILPRTVAEAVSTSDGSNVQTELDNLKKQVPDVSEQINAHNTNPEAHESIRTEISTHVSNKENPHQVTASQVGADVSGSAAQALVDAKSYTDQKIAAIPTPDVSAQIEAHNTSTAAHANMHWLTADDEMLSSIEPDGSIDADTLEGHPASYFATQTDLSGYVLKSELSTLVPAPDLSNYYTKEEVDAKITQIQQLIDEAAALVDQINGEVI